jgi:hypothetical protein
MTSRPRSLRFLDEPTVMFNRALLGRGQRRWIEDGFGEYALVFDCEANALTSQRFRRFHARLGCVGGCRNFAACHGSHLLHQFGHRAYFHRALSHQTPELGSGLGQIESLEETQQLRHRNRRVDQTGLLIPHDFDDGSRCHIEEMSEELIRVYGLNVVGSQHCVREVPEVACDDDVGCSDNSRRQNVPVIGSGSGRVSIRCS